MENTKNDNGNTRFQLEKSNLVWSLCVIAEQAVPWVVDLDLFEDMDLLWRQI